MSNSPNYLGFARQPIFDKHLNVVAYELLYQSEHSDEIVKLLRGDEKACSVLINNFTSVYDAGSLKTLPAFLNVSADFIRTESLPLLTHHNLVIDIEQTAPDSPKLLKQLTRCADEGYRIALNGVNYTSSCDSLLRLVQIVRINIQDKSEETLFKVIKQLQPYNVTLLAEHVTNHEEYKKYIALGFSLFQGPFLSHPTLITGKKLTSNQAIVIHLLAALQDKDVSAETLSDLISRDPQLTFNLLRIVNSAQFNLPNEINSLIQAILALGLNEINKWATLLALSSNDDQPSELIRQILITARMCEFIAQHTKETDADQAFFCGVLSMLDALLQIPQTQLLDQLSLSEGVIRAITLYEGNTGQLLQTVNLYIIGQTAFEIPPQLLPIYNDAYYEALRWSNEAMQLMQGENK